MMKTTLLKKSLLLITLAVTTHACRYLDPEEYTIRTAGQVREAFYYYQSLRAGAYTNLPTGYNTIGNSWLAAACDEAEDVNPAEAIQSLNIGNWDQFSNPDDRWNTLYAGIRKTFDFTLLTDGQDWEAYRLSDPTEYQKRIYLTDMYRNEMTFLRAFYYFELIKRYGGVPLVKKKLDVNAELPEMRQMERAEFAQCVDYIVDQCDLAAEKLPETHELSDAGSPTKGAALALKVRTLLYAASDLFNRTDNSDPVTGYVGGDRRQRWEKAARAALAVLNMSAYRLNDSYSALFLLGSAQNKEIIFERRRGLQNSFETLNYPITFNGGKTGTCPSQNLVDSYEMQKDGSAFDWNAPGLQTHPYEGRDPRLKMTIVVNGSKWNGRDIEIWEGGRDGNPIDKTTKTGYYLRKYVVENLDLTKNNTSYHQWIYFRLAEMYLNYAEAMNEAFGPDYTDSEFTLSARDAVNLVRGRADVKMPPFPAGMTQESFRERLRNERRVELAFEDHRFWDLRRWDQAAQGIGGELRGVRITKGNGDGFIYQPFVVEKRNYVPRMALYPIPASEISKSNGHLKQNPDW